MATALDPLPLTETLTPSDQPALAAAVREAFAARQPVYPLGGGTSLDYGLPAKLPGIGLSTAGIARVVDYPARDMTITVETGLTLAQLAETLATEGQRLPIDAPQASTASLGGLIATNFSGPRRYGQGTLRDYVIGISAVDGRGTPFKAGGRVVKNVAGYDFCKLLTGSLGTLGVLTQVTLKVKPLPESSVLLSAGVQSLADAEPLLAALVTSRITPTAIELLAGPAWSDAGVIPPGSAAALVVGLEGTSGEVAWMTAQLQREWTGTAAQQVQVWQAAEAQQLWSKLTEFPAAENAALLLQASVRPSRLVDYCELLAGLPVPCSLQAHAGTGVVLARFDEFAAADISPLLIKQFHPAAQQRDGQAKVWRAASSLGELPRQAIWGTRAAPVEMMESIRQQFDPAGILNPGRFVY